MSDSESDDIYEVEQITNHVVCDYVTYYCVTWKGYEGPEAQTWEPKENLLSCEDLLNAYIANINKNAEAERANKQEATDVSSEESGPDEVSKKEKPDRRESKDDDKDISQKPKRGRGRPRGRGRGKTQAGTVRPRRKPSPSSSSEDTSSDESPHIKDPFWADLEMGKVNVFAEDLYSKVKRRRDGNTDEPQPDSTVLLPAVTSVKKRGPKKKSHDKDASKEDEEPKQHRPDVSDKPESMREKSPFSSDDEKSAASSTVTSPVLEYLDDQLLGKKKRPKKKKEKISETKTDKERGTATVLKAAKEVAESSKAAVRMETEESEDVKDAPVNDKKKSTPRGAKKKSAKTMEEIALKEPPKLSSSSFVSSESKDKTEKTQAPFEAKKSPTEEVASPSDKLDTFSNVLQQLDYALPTIVPKKDKKKHKKSLGKKSVSPPLLEEDRMDASKNKLDEPKEKPPVKEKRSDSGSKEVSSKAQNKESAGGQSTPSKRPALPKLTDSARKKEKEKSKIKEKQSLLPSEKTPYSERKSKHKSSVSGISPTKPPSLNSKASKSSAAESSQRATESFSVFEAMQKEFEASNFSATRPQSSPEDDDANTKDHVSREVVNENVDMSEYLKVKVNFSLDEVSLKDIEQHHEVGEPPCRLGREISNAEFRQFIRSNNYEMVFEVLKSKGRMYNLEHQDSMWMTQLMIASAAGYSEIVKVLAHHGARVNARTKSNQTALMFAAEKGHAITVQILLMYGAYVNLQTSSGETALMKAVKGGHVEIAHCLLQAGADPCIKSPHGVSALNIEGRMAGTVVGMVKKYKQTIEMSVHNCVRQTLQQLGLKAMGSSLFGVKVYNVREHALLYFTYHCNLQDIPPNQGLVLFAVHGMTGPGLSIKCRMRGPCNVNAITVNNSVMDPLMPSKENEKYSHFMTNVAWRNGQNSFRLFLAQDGLSREKLYLCAFVVGFG